MTSYIDLPTPSRLYAPKLNVLKHSASSKTALGIFFILTVILTSILTTGITKAANPNPTKIHANCSDDIDQRLVDNHGAAIADYCLDKSANKIYVKNNHSRLFVSIVPVNSSYISLDTSGAPNDLYKDAHWAYNERLVAPGTIGIVSFDPNALEQNWQTIVKVEAAPIESFNILSIASVPGINYVSNSNNPPYVDVAAGTLQEWLPDVSDTYLQEFIDINPGAEELPSGILRIKLGTITELIKGLGILDDSLKVAGIVLNYREYKTEKLAYTGTQIMRIDSNHYPGGPAYNNLPDEPLAYNPQDLQNKIVEIPGLSLVVFDYNNRTYSQITDRTTLACLENSGYSRLPAIPRLEVESKWGYTKTTHNFKGCFNASDYKNKIVTFENGRNYLIDSLDNENEFKIMHIADSSTYNCLKSKYGSQALGNVEEKYFRARLNSGSEARCFEPAYYEGKIIDLGTYKKYFVSRHTDQKIYLHHIPTSEVYNCLVALGHPDIGSQEASYLGQYLTYAPGEATCLDRNKLLGNIVNFGSKSYYIHNDGALQWIKFQGDYQCYKSLGSLVFTKYSAAVIKANFKEIGGNASCYKDADFQSAVVSPAGTGASYYIHNGYIYDIPSTSAYHCMLERSGVRLIKGMELGYVTENNKSLGDVSCYSKNSMAHNVTRDTRGIYWFTNNNGYRYRIKDGHHTNCLKRRDGYTGTVGLSDLYKYAYNGNIATCHDINAYAGKMIRRPDGAVFYVTHSGTKQHIATGEVLSCLTRKIGRGYINVSSTVTSRIDSAGTYGTCLETHFRNRIIRRSNGTAYWIDAHGRRFWVPDGHTWNCFGGWGKVENNVTVDTERHYRYYGHARCYNGQILNNRVIRHVNGDAHYISWSGTRYWLGSGSAYWRYRHHTGATHINIYSRWLINSIHYGGARY